MSRKEGKKEGRRGGTKKRDEVWVVGGGWLWLRVAAVTANAYQKVGPCGNPTSNNPGSGRGTSFGQIQNKLAKFLLHRLGGPLRSYPPRHRHLISIASWTALRSATLIVAHRRRVNLN